MNPVVIKRETLDAVSGLIERRMGLHFPAQRNDALAQGLARAGAELGFGDPAAYASRLLTSGISQDEQDILARALTVGETYFYREPAALRAFVEQFLPPLIEARTKSGEKRIRIWSAGCSTGEEAYTIAIALRRTIPDVDTWRIGILATDINPHILRKAAAAVYREWSFRNAPVWLKEHYFTATTEGSYALIPEIRQMVTFAYLNLAEDAFPSALNNTNGMDVILCRNVLMYFTAERGRQIGENLHRALLPGGWLMVSACELSQRLFPQFRAVHFQGAVVYRKESAAQPPVVVVSADPAAIPQSVFAHPTTPSVALDEVDRGELGTAAVAPSLRVVPRGISDRPSREAPTEPLDSGAADAQLTVVAAVRALADRGNLEDALAACDAALATDSLDQRLHFVRASILLEQNREAEATAALRRAVYLDADYVPALFAMGNQALRQGKIRAAKKCFQNLLAVVREHSPADILPDTDGLTAGRLTEIVQSALEVGALA